MGDDVDGFDVGDVDVLGSNVGTTVGNTLGNAVGTQLGE